jgi:hypothetical protein
MATAKKNFHVVHPVRHDGKAYDRGAKIPVEKFTDGEARRLVKSGHLSTTAPVADALDDEAETTE